MKRILTGLVLALALSAFAGAALAESARSTETRLWKAYSKGFSAHCVAVATEKDGGKVKSTMEMEFYLGQKKMRMDTDLSKAKSAGKDKDEDKAARNGMNKSSVIVDMDKKMSYVLFPDSKTYMAMDMSKNSKMNKGPKQDWWTRDDLQIEDQGSETVAGHACRKVKATWTDTPEKGKPVTSSALMWLAKDMEEFPVQVQPQNDGDEQMTMTYSDVKRGAPDASLFEVPSDYKKFGFGSMFKSPKGGSDDKDAAASDSKDDDKSKDENKDEGGLGGMLKRGLKGK